MSDEPGRSTPPGDGGPRSVEEARERLRVWIEANIGPTIASPATPRQRESIATLLDALVAAVRADEREAHASDLARALCDSSSHINLLPHDEQRPCAYHIQRARNTVALLRARECAARIRARGRPLG